MAGAFQSSAFQNSAFQTDRRTGGYDTSDAADPQFYDWWRKRAKEERDKLEFVAAGLAEYDASDPPLELETVKAIESADSIASLRELELLARQRSALDRLIADYQKFLDEDEEEALLLALLH